jgi:hypothetical protein
MTGSRALLPTIGRAPHHDLNNFYNFYNFYNSDKTNFQTSGQNHILGLFGWPKSPSRNA